ncbi:hypothetical protein N0V88_008101 [Collariella sp. IMI 366227]|nr:hypothetical protein N0V88_008101 [Collariella sp. IMI 366227]
MDLRQYRGDCAGDTVYRTDGPCSSEHSNRLYAGKWGDCCNFSGQYGTGASFCAEKQNKCHKHHENHQHPAPPKIDGPLYRRHRRRKPRWAMLMDLLARLLPITLHLHDARHTRGPAPSDRLPRLRNPESHVTSPGFPLLCNFVCFYTAEYCPEQVCTKMPYSTTQQPGTVCVQGQGEGGHAGLCSYACHYSFCPSESCTCTLYGQAIQEPPLLNTPGGAAPGIDGSFSSLCGYICNHGYCPPGVCVYLTK